jgi:Immunity protein 7
MYQFHGWFALAETPHDIDDGGLKAVLPELQEYLDRFTGGSTVAELHWRNGEPFVNVDGMANRPRQDGVALTDLLNFLAQRLPGSYGLLYESDDERIEPPGNNAFRVRVLARGSVTERDDPFLSPRHPVIED